MNNTPGFLTTASPEGYGSFLREAKARIRQQQYQALRAANKELLALYWWLGQAISKRQAEMGWGKAVVETLAKDLQKEFPGNNEFSAQDLWLMRQLFMEYGDKPKLQPLVGEISWTKNLLIMARCKDDLEREFYFCTAQASPIAQSSRNCQPTSRATCRAHKTLLHGCKHGKTRKAGEMGHTKQKCSKSIACCAYPLLL